MSTHKIYFSEKIRKNKFSLNIALDKRGYQINIFLFFPRKHILQVLVRNKKKSIFF